MILHLNFFDEGTSVFECLTEEGKTCYLDPYLCGAFSQNDSPPESLVGKRLSIPDECQSVPPCYLPDGEVFLFEEGEIPSQSTKTAPKTIRNVELEELIKYYSGQIFSSILSRSPDADPDPSYCVFQAWELARKVLASFEEDR